MAVTYAKDERQNLRWTNYMDKPHDEQRLPNRGEIVSVCGSAFDVRFAQRLLPIYPVPRASLVIHQQAVNEAKEAWRNEGNPN
jgi:hypothetical protein